MKEKIEILCTLGPESLNKKFLNFANKNITLLRLNMSHIRAENLEEIIKYVKKNSKIPICIDTEGAQIRSKVKKKIFLKKNKIFNLYNKGGGFNLYPEEIFNKLKKNDILEIGFDDLRAIVININKNIAKLKVISSGLLDKNKGVHVSNRKLKINYLTTNDLKAIDVAKKNNIHNYALSFTSSTEDISKFKKILPNKNKIYKIETKIAVKNFSSLMKHGDNFLIDRGDLSKDVKTEMIPIMQRKILKMSKSKKNKKIFIATNFLDNMIHKDSPTRGEANDIFNCLELGASGLVLAAETAIGKNPINSVLFLKKMINVFKIYNKNL